MLVRDVLVISGFWSNFLASVRGILLVVLVESCKLSLGLELLPYRSGPVANTQVSTCSFIISEDYEN